jgi:hypothetical protein
MHWVFHLQTYKLNSTLPPRAEFDNNIQTTPAIFSYNLDPIREYDWMVKIECYTHTYSTPILEPPDPYIESRDERQEYLISKIFHVKLSCPVSGVKIEEPLDIKHTWTFDADPIAANRAYF